MLLPSTLDFYPCQTTEFQGTFRRFFPSASGFEIKGPIFNSHIYPSPISQSPNAPGIPSTSKVHSDRERDQSFGIPFVESEIYAQMLLLRKRGYPLWKPKSHNTRLPEVYKKNGVHIGDVGILTESGGFDYLFNVCHGANHELNFGRVPEDFKPILDLDADDTEENDEEYPKGSHVSSDPNRIHQSTIQVENSYQGSATQFEGVPEGGVTFWSTTSKGALLILPEGGKSVNHLQREKFEDYAAECATSWYTHVGGALGRKINNGSLYLITGFDKARAWGVASFSNATPENISLEFVPRSSKGKTRYPEYYFRTSNSAVSSSGADDIYGQQSGCVFLRGLKIAIRQSWFREMVAETTQVSSLEFDDLLPRLSDNRNKWWLTRKIGQWFGLLQQLSSASPTNLKHQLDQDLDSSNDVLTLDYTPDIQVYHPSDVINNSLLGSTMGTPTTSISIKTSLDIAITHDDEWAALIRDDDEEMPDTKELILRVQASQPHIRYNTTFKGLTYICLSTSFYSTSRPLMTKQPISRPPTDGNRLAPNKPSRKEPEGSSLTIKGPSILAELPFSQQTKTPREGVVDHGDFSVINDDYNTSNTALDAFFTSLLNDEMDAGGKETRRPITPPSRESSKARGYF
ncbi:hypothetical protein EV361DRAFT_900389 [Lentinula raphanica]|nr:hypothetical protein EV361DRAFT_900389 [Lentinula raphanica]